MGGKSKRQGRSVAGLMLAGPVEPKQEPTALMQMTKYVLVSIAKPGPMMASHHPGVGSVSLAAACALA